MVLHESRVDIHARHTIKPADKLIEKRPKAIHDAAERLISSLPTSRSVSFASLHFADDAAHEHYERHAH